jgi:hypothetical protein
MSHLYDIGSTPLILAAGLWLAISPLLLGFASNAAAGAHLVSGIALGGVAALRTADGESMRRWSAWLVAAIGVALAFSAVLVAPPVDVVARSATLTGGALVLIGGLSWMQSLHNGSTDERGGGDE